MRLFLAERPCGLNLQPALPASPLLNASRHQSLCLLPRPPIAFLAHHGHRVETARRPAGVRLAANSRSLPCICIPPPQLHPMTNAPSRIKALDTQSRALRATVFPADAVVDTAMPSAHAARLRHASLRPSSHPITNAPQRIKASSQLSCTPNVDRSQGSFVVIT